MVIYSLIYRILAIPSGFSSNFMSPQGWNLVENHGMILSNDPPLVTTVDG